MKKFLSIYIVLFLALGLNGFSQTLDERADLLTREMAGSIKLNKKKYEKLKALNKERLAQIDRLADLREQDTRYLDIRLDQIEEVYHSNVYNLLSAQQYKNFRQYKLGQPNSYAGITQGKLFQAAIPEKE